MLTSPSHVRLCSLLASASRAAGASVAGIGGLVLVGWTFRIPVLMSVVPGLAAMKANTAVGFLLAGAALWLLNGKQSVVHRRRMSHVCAAFVALIGALTISEDLLGRDLGIDQWLIRDLTVEDLSLAPGRMAPITALGLIFAALSLLWLDARGGQRWSQSLALLAGLCGLFGLMCFAFGVEPLSRLAAASRMPLPTAVAFVLLSAGILFARPDEGLMNVLTSDGTSGTLTRRLLPAAIVVPLVLGWLRLQGQRAGLFDTEFGLAIFAVANTIVFSTLVLWNAHLLHRSDTQRKQSEEAIANYNERLRILRQIDRALIAGEELTTLAATVLPPFRELLGVPRAIVNLFDLANGEVEWFAAAGRRRVRVGPGVRYSIRFMGDVEALQRGELQLIDVHALPPSPEVDALLASGVHTYAVVPMIAGGELIGAISFGGMPGPFSTEQVNIAQDVATQFAIALTQVRLHERVKRHAQELEFRVRERTRELEAANQELDAFSYSVSHDLRAPLRAIDGFSRILLMEHAANMPAEAQEYLRDIRSNTQQMGRLVDDLLSFSRLSRQPLTKQPVDPAEIVSRCLAELQAQREGRQVEIRLNELPTCQADPMLLKQVWINLLSNALKYSSKREAALIEVGSRDGDVTGPRTYFVKDNGVGFDMRYAHKLFGVFQRLHRAEDYEGTGVGLANVQRIIHRHGGRVWAEAQPDIGATFYFTLEDAEASS